MRIDPLLTAVRQKAYKVIRCFILKSVAGCIIPSIVRSFPVLQKTLRIWVTIASGLNIQSAFFDLSILMKARLKATDQIVQPR